MVGPINEADRPQHAVNREYLEKSHVQLADNDRLPNAPELGFWIEWLMHPEEHNGPRVVFALEEDQQPEGTPIEVPSNIQHPKYADHVPPYPDEANPESLPPRDGRGAYGTYLPYESVFERWNFSQFFGCQAAVATQEVDGEECPLAGAATGLLFLYRMIDDHDNRLTEDKENIDERNWGGQAGERYRESLGTMLDLASKMREVIDQAVPAIGAYAFVIQHARKGLNESAGTLTSKLSEKANYESGGPSGVLELLIDLVFNRIGTKASEMIDNILGKNLAGDAVKKAWTGLLGYITGSMKAGESPKDAPAASYDHLAKAYLRGQVEMLDKATARVNELTEKINAECAILRSAPAVPVAS